MVGNAMRTMQCIDIHPLQEISCVGKILRPLFPVFLTLNFFVVENITISKDMLKLSHTKLEGFSQTCILH